MSEQCEVAGNSVALKMEGRAISCGMSFYMRCFYGMMNKATLVNGLAE